MAYQLQGTVHKIFDTEQVTDSFQKRVVVISYASNPMYPQHVSFEFVQNAVTAPDSVQEGQMVQVDFDISGREWTSPQGEVKYFNTLRAWRIAPIQQAQTQSQPPQQQPQQQPQQTTQPVQQPMVNDEPEDDLPF